MILATAHTSAGTRYTTPSAAAGSPEVFLVFEPERYLTPIYVLSEELESAFH